MSTTEILRLLMQLDLRRTELPAAVLPVGYRWVSWRPMLVERHAAVKWRAFRGGGDSLIFPCLGDAEGCRRLMRLISGHAAFCPEATWMVTYHPEDDWPADDCATIQGIIRNGRSGAIQNVGVIPGHRRLGIGRALVLQALAGFRDLGLVTATLEVTADNHAAVALYESLGFHVTRELLRSSESLPPTAIP